MSRPTTNGTGVKRGLASTDAPFRDAVDHMYHTKQIGENGMPEYTNSGIGLNVLALSQMVRGGDPGSLVDQILAGTNTNEIVDLIVLLFVTRNCRGGKGEKKLSFDVFLRIWRQYPKTAKELLRLFPVYLEGSLAVDGSGKGRATVC